MSSELELRLERLFAAMAPSSESTLEHARRTALEALGTNPPTRRWFGTYAVALAALAACLVAGGVTLAATHAVDIPLIQARPAATHSTLPAATSPLSAGTTAFVVKIDGRAWHAHAHGVTLAGGRLSALALSPGALYALRAKGHQLRAVSSQTGRVAFTLRTVGTVTAAAWSPLPIRIAYIERVDHHFVMHDMWGTGSHDRQAHGLAAPVAPSWRWDSLAVAYVRANGRVAVLSPTTGAVETLPRACAIGHAQAVAYSPTSDLLAIADDSHTAVLDTSVGSVMCLTRHTGTPSLAWIGGRKLALGAGHSLTISTIDGSGMAARTYNVDGSVTAVAVSPHGGRLVLAVSTPAGTSIAPFQRGHIAAPLFTLRRRHGATSIQWR